MVMKHPGYFEQQERIAADWEQYQLARITRVYDRFYDPNRDKTLRLLLDHNLYDCAFVRYQTVLISTQEWVKTGKVLPESVKSALERLETRVKRYAQQMINLCNNRHHLLDAKRMERLYKYTLLFRELGIPIDLSKWMQHQFIMFKLES